MYYGAGYLEGINQLGNLIGNFGDFYNKNKNKVTRLDSSGFSVVDPEIKSESSSKGSVTRRGGREFDMNNPADVADLKKLQEQELTRQRNRGLGMSDIRGGDGLKSDGSDERLPQGTDLGNSGPKPMNWAQYEEFLNNYGREDGVGGIRLSGFESNDLPGGIKATLNTKSLVGVSQAGASEEADISDQSRAIGVDLTKNRALPRGARQQEMFLRQNPNYGQSEVPEIDKGSGLSARSRAFLDYDGKGGSLGALRAADASQNLMRYGDKFAVKVGDNDYKEISREGAEAIRGGKRNDREFEQEFLSQYLTTPAKPADSQSEDSVQPKPVTRDLTTMAESYKPGYFPKELGFNYSLNDEAPDMGLDPKLFSYMRFK